MCILRFKEGFENNNSDEIVAKRAAAIIDIARIVKAIDAGNMVKP